MPSTPPKSSVQLHRIANNGGSCLKPSGAGAAAGKTACGNRILFTPTPAARGEVIPDYVLRLHAHAVGPNQCCSAVVQHIVAPVAAVWSVVRRFDNPQAYKHFVKSCSVITGDGDVGTLREVRVVSGLPAISSTERLEILDDERHVLSFSVVGGDHRLANYRSVTTLHPSSASGNAAGTLVVESYVVDVPQGNTREDTCVFVDTIVKCNLHSLAQIAQSSIRSR